MCPLWPLHILLLYAVTLCPLWMLSTAAVELATEKMLPWRVHFLPENLVLPMGEEALVTFWTAEDVVGDVQVVSDSAEVATAGPVALDATTAFGNQTGAFNVSGQFLGYASLRLTQGGRQCEAYRVAVVRRKRFLDHAFTGSIIVLASVLYINFGCALDWPLMKKTIRRPVGPAIGFISQFLFMPLASFALGRLLFPNSPTMQLGLFFTGVSPAGGASNMWTCILGGNLNLSITMTAICTLAAFAMMPLWIFTLGHVIFNEAKLGVPYDRIGTFAVGLLLPLSVGFLLQRYAPRISRFMVSVLKPFSLLLIVFIVVFAIITNYYIFQLFTWQIFVAGMALPWLGYFCGLIFARLARQPPDDVLAISIETGVQNTGISIFLLIFSLGQPAGDLTTIIPVAVAIMTPLPLLVLYVWRRIRGVSRAQYEPHDDDVSGDARKGVFSTEMAAA